MMCPKCMVKRVYIGQKCADPECPMRVDAPGTAGGAKVTHNPAFPTGHPMEFDADPDRPKGVREPDGKYVHHCPVHGRIVNSSEDYICYECPRDDYLTLGGVKFKRTPCPVGHKGACGNSLMPNGALTCSVEGCDINKKDPHSVEGAYHQLTAPAIDHRAALETYLKSCVNRRDWHGVMDAACDIMVWEAEQRVHRK